MSNDDVKHARQAAALLACMILLIAFAAGCGGSNSSRILPPTPTPTPTPTTANAQVRIGDSPVDSIIDFEFSIGSPVVFTQTGGTTVSVATGPNRFELSHLAAKLEPLALINVPPGNYISATLTIENPELTYLSSTGTPVTISGANQTLTIPFPSITIGAGPAIVNIDVNVANSVLQAGSPTGGSSIVGFNFNVLSFKFTLGSIAAENQQEDDSGEIEGLVGKVTSATISSFVLNTGSNSELGFAVDSTTQYKDGLSNIAGTLNQLVRVEGVTRPDGTLFAKEVARVTSLGSTTGAELDGIIRLVTGNPASSFKFIAQDGIGDGMDSTKIGGEFTADVTALAASKYLVDQGKCDFGSLTVPSATFPFDATKIKEGQRVEVDTVSGVPPVNGNFLADKVRLQQQALKGTVSNFTPGAGGAATFDLTVPADSYLAILNPGVTPLTVHVYLQPGTNNKLGAIANTSSARVRGLLFWTGTQFNMIARRVTAPSQSL
jgi:Domain of unknown function (DUF5666)